MSFNFRFLIKVRGVDATLKNVLFNFLGRFHFTKLFIFHIHKFFQILIQNQVKIVFIIGLFFENFIKKNVSLNVC